MKKQTNHWRTARLKFQEFECVSDFCSKNLTHKDKLADLVTCIGVLNCMNGNTV